MHHSPNIWRCSVFGSVVKYEKIKKGCQGGIVLSQIDVFRKEKGHSYMLYITCERVETRQEIFGGKMDIFLLKRSFGPRKS